MRASNRNASAHPDSRPCPRLLSQSSFLKKLQYGSLVFHPRLFWVSVDVCFVQYCDEGLIKEVVMPLLSVSSSVLLCISTLLESGAPHSRFPGVRA